MVCLAWFLKKHIANGSCYINFEKSDSVYFKENNANCIGISKFFFWEAVLKNSKCRLHMCVKCPRLKTI